MLKVMRNPAVLLRHAVLLLVGLNLLLERAIILNYEFPTFAGVDNPHAHVDQPVLRVLGYSYLWSLNAWLLLAPVWLCHDWASKCIAVVRSALDSRLVVPAAFLLLVVVVVKWMFTPPITAIKRLFMKGAALGVITYLPSCHVLLSVGFVIAERVLYLPSMGYCLVMALACCSCYYHVSDFHKKLMYMLLTIVALLMITKTYKRSYEWTTDYLLGVSGSHTCGKQPKIYYNMAGVKADKGQFQEAVEQYLLAMNIDPLYDKAAYNLGTLYYEKLNNTSAAKKYLLKAVEINPKLVRGWNNLGLVQNNLNESNEAIQSLKTALKLKPRYPTALYNLGRVYQHMNRSTEALHSWYEAVLIQPSYINAWVNLVLLLNDLGRADEAISMGHESVKKNPFSDALHFNLALCLKKLKFFKLSEKHFKEAIRLKASVARYYAGLGDLYYVRGRPRLARQWYERGLAIDITYEPLVIALFRVDQKLRVFTPAARRQKTKQKT